MSIQERLTTHDIQVPLLMEQREQIPDSTIRKSDETAKYQIDYAAKNAFILHKKFHSSSKIDTNCSFCLEETHLHQKSESEEQISIEINKKNSTEPNGLNVERDCESQGRDSDAFDSSSDDSQDIQDYIRRARGYNNKCKSIFKCLSLYMRKNKCQSFCHIIRPVVMLWSIYAKYS